jgi:hypothetical protein
LKAVVAIVNDNPRRLLAGMAVTVGGFVALGTVAALWENPFFVRMTPAGGWEIGLLAILSLLGGAYVLVRRSFCSNGSASAAGILGFLGVACPICNVLLVMIFGGELLLTYYEPIRIYMTVFAIALIGWLVIREWRYRAEV